MTDFFEPAARGVQHSSLRAANRRAVLTTIAFNPGSSNADVSRKTGLAPQTASAIVAELEDEGLISRGEVLRGRRGQPATPLFLKLDAAYSIGCHVGWQRIDIVLIDLSAKPIARYRRAFAYLDGKTILDELVSAIDGLLEKLDESQRQRFVGIGLSTPTNIGDNIHLLDAPSEQADIWKQLDLRTSLEDMFGLPALWFNDGNSACWAELVMMPAPRPSSFAYLFVGTFLGAGIVAEHVLGEGPSGNSANLGAIRIQKADGSCDFGHFVASLHVLEKQLEEAGIEPPRVAPELWPSQDWRPQVDAWLAECSDALAQIILNSSAVVEFDIAVIDGAMPREIVDRLVTLTREAIRRMPTLATNRPRVEIGRLGADSVPLGAAFMPIYRRYFSRKMQDMLDWEPGISEQ